MSSNNTFLETMLTPSQVADMLGVSVGTLSVWRTTGRYEVPFIKVGRNVRYKLKDIQAFLAGRVFTSTAQHRHAGV
jgi:excisionase family DNA binding protein